MHGSGKRNNSVLKPDVWNVNILDMKLSDRIFFRVLIDGISLNFRLQDGVTKKHNCDQMYNMGHW